MLLTLDSAFYRRLAVTAAALIAYRLGCAVPVPGLSADLIGPLVHSSGLPPELFTPTFASSRVIGWCANILEQAADNRIIRPSARYVGPPPPQPVPPED